MTLFSNMTGIYIVLVLSVVSAFSYHCISEFYPPDTNVTSGAAFDFIIVGSGSAGSVVARRLSEVKTWKILLIEAGEDPLPESDVPALWPILPSTRMNWAFQSVPQTSCCLGMVNKTCALPQGKVLGGGSTINLLAYIRGNADDFDEWHRMGNHGWDYQTVLTYFKKSEHQTCSQLFNHYHGRNGLQGVSFLDTNKRVIPIRDALFAAVEELGINKNFDVNGAYQTGFGPFQGTVLRGRRHNTGKSFLGGGALKNLIVTKKSLTEKVLFKNGRVTGVQFRKNGRSVVVKARKEVVLSAGGINSPQLLMLSGIGPKEDLKRMNINVICNVESVGKNFQDHYVFGGNVYKLRPTMQCNENPAAQLEQYFETQTGEMASMGLINELIGFVDTVSGTEVPDQEFVGSAYCVKDIDILRTRLPGVRPDIVQMYLDGVRDHDFLIIPNNYLKPESLGEIRLRSTNASDQPEIDPNVLSDFRDVRSMIRGVRLLRNLLNTTALRYYEPEFIDAPIPECAGFRSDTDKRYECLIRHLTFTTAHYSGTCKMGPRSDPMAVVDPRLRVYGVKGLRVVDNSIMPKVTRGNTNAPAIMIGERGADFIKQDWKIAEKFQAECVT